jgi:hypothetical protein
MAGQATLEEEICNVIADGEESKIFLNEMDGIWIGGVNKNKHGIIASNLKSCRKEDAKYSEHIDQIMNFPPKMRILKLPKWGGGISISSTNPNVTNHTSRTSSQPQATHTKINHETNNRFDNIYAELNIQCECNTQFDARISNLEITTQQIDDKIDLVLDRLAPSSPSHKIQKTTQHQHNESNHHPGWTSQSNSSKGSLPQGPL